MTIKQSACDLGKNELAAQVGANHNSIQTWRTKYKSGGIKELLSDGRIGFKPAMISKEAHEQLRMKLHDAQGGFTSFKELQHRVDAHLKKVVILLTAYKMQCPVKKNMYKCATQRLLVAALLLGS